MPGAPHAGVSWDMSAAVRNHSIFIPSATYRNGPTPSPSSAARKQGKEHLDQGLVLARAFLCVKGRAGTGEKE